MQKLTRKAVFPYLLLVIAMLAWAGNFIVGRAIGDEMSALTLVLWRNILGLFLILPWTWYNLYQHRNLLWQSRWNLILLGTLGVGMFNYFAYTGLKSTSATNAVLLMSITPLVIILLSYIFLRQTIRRVQLMGIVISFIGVAIIISRGQPQQLLQLKLNQGDMWIFAAILVWSIYSIALRWRATALPSLTFLCALIIVGISVLLPAQLLSYGYLSFEWVQTPTLAFSVIYIALFPLLLAYSCWNHAVTLIGANTAGQFIHLQPVFGTVLAVLVLGEQVFWFHWLGLIVVFSGIYSATR